MDKLTKDDMRACGQICLDCLRVCGETITGCLTKGGKHGHVDHINQLLDCMLMCETAASFLNRRSALCAQICELCAEVCEECAASCEGWEDNEMDRCADECRSCAESCRSMLS